MSHAAYRGSHGGMLTFNINDGYLDGLIRGFRSGILAASDYGNLVQCDTLEGELQEDDRERE